MDRKLPPKGLRPSRVPGRVSLGDSDQGSAVGDPPPAARRGIGSASRPVSLKGAALRLLSRREFSRHELAQRLRSKAESPEALERVLDEVQARKFQSDDRFTENLVRRRAGQYGARRIEFELEQHRIDPALASKTLAELSGTERERALAIWQRRFDSSVADLAEKAKQYRFLAQRGFDGDTINWVLKQAVKPLC